MHQALQKYFGYSSFIPPQEEIIKDLLAGRDVLALMPTGGGKSLCYQLPAVLRSGLVVVVSPLIALMKDQVDGLKASGIMAAQLSSAMDSDEIGIIVSDLLDQKIKVLYLSPERAVLPEFLSFLDHLDINLIAIDEAHCISEWGHDFRPSYRKLRVLKERFPKVAMIGLTATAIPEVEKDIVRQLQMKDPKIYRASFNRRNLYYQILPKKDAYSQIRDYLSRHRGSSGIIYCSSRRSADSVSAKLQADGFPARPYHAGLDPHTRAKAQDEFVREEIEIIVATVAFGMGIDKSNVRFVIHYDMPMSLEAYYQETGRAGRDGHRSDCLLFFSSGDARKIEYLIEKKVDALQRISAKRKLEEMMAFCQSRECRRKALMGYFGEPFHEKNCKSCDNCADQGFDATVLAQKAISCISQTGERFGVNHISAVLCGSRSKKVLSHGHELLPSHGSGRDLSQERWQELIRELIQRGCLCSEGGPRPVVRLNLRSQNILCGKERILLEGQFPICQDPDIDGDLFEMLRRLRKRIADSEKMPPYIIFHDSTLKEMASRGPRDLQDFASINGVGEAKLRRYGEIFTREIAKYCAGRASSSPASPQVFATEPRPEQKPLADWFYQHNAWSYSRHRLWSRCRRAYFYNYIAPALRDPGCMDISRIHRLRALEPSQVIQGKLIHEIIEQQISRTRLGHVADEEMARSQYSQRLDVYRIGAERMVAEEFNGHALGDDFFEDILESGLQQIGTFFKVIWPGMEGMEYLNHEQVEAFHLGDVPVAVKLDYVCRDGDDGLIISDWKTGAGVETERRRSYGDLQMGSYALWARECLMAEPEKTLCRLVYLASGRSESLRFSWSDLEGIRVKIIQGFREINQGFDQERFHPDPNPRKCHSCRFSTICAGSLETHKNQQSGQDI
ncbi:MAG TPA: DNA helicase RecQ [Methanotrichaceae archaeon]|nr:DNA helicase RecQ [Methanotrichaceae archaeon]